MVEKQFKLRTKEDYPPTSVAPELLSQGQGSPSQLCVGVTFGTARVHFILENVLSELAVEAERVLYVP
jgi:hypothetical protein